MAPTTVVVKKTPMQKTRRAPRIPIRLPVDLVAFFIDEPHSLHDRPLFLFIFTVGMGFGFNSGSGFGCTFLGLLDDGTGEQCGHAPLIVG